MRTLTPSAIAVFTHCPAKYQYSYLWKLSPILYIPSLVLGKGLRAGITELQSTPGSDGPGRAILRARAAMKDDLLKLRALMDRDEFDAVLEQAKRDRAKVCAMLRAYRQVYPKNLPLVRHVGLAKCRFTPRPIINPATGKDSRTFNISGVFDGYFRLDDGGVMLYQVLSTSESLKEARALLAQSVEPQLLLSMMPTIETGYLAGILLDIVKKPVASFTTAKIKRRKGESDEAWTARQLEEERREPLKDFEDRCYKAYLQQPDRFFLRLRLPVDPLRIRDAQAAAWRIAREIRESDRHGYLACRGTNCKNSRGWCEYRALCWYHRTENYVHGEYAHEELELAA